MCGIAGFIERLGGQADLGRHARMTDCIAYRGPDDAGARAIGSVGLGHRRLSIVDVSPAGHQPKPGPGEQSWIVYNGELYNNALLRHQLHDFLTRSAARTTPRCSSERSIPMALRCCRN